MNYIFNSTIFNNFVNIKNLFEIKLALQLQAT